MFNHVYKKKEKDSKNKRIFKHCKQYDQVGVGIQHLIMYGIVRKDGVKN